MGTDAVGGDRVVIEIWAPNVGMAVLGPPSLVGVGGTTLDVTRDSVLPDRTACGRLGSAMENRP